MTCRANRGKGQLGHTFLELSLALAIVAVIFFSVIPLILSSQRERRLKESMDAICQLARDGRFAAEKSGLPETLVFQTNGIKSSRKNSELPPVQISNSKLFIRYPGGKWEKADGQDWKFYSCGEVEPISVRLEADNAWVESDFDFLTGSVSDERYSF